MRYTRYELEEKIETLRIRKEQLQQLCKWNDNRIFDITYNVSEAFIKEWSPRLCQELQDICVKRKKLHYDSFITEMGRKSNFHDLLQDIERYFSSTEEIMYAELNRY